MSPGASSPIYNRFKYYSALKTGFEHLQPQQPQEGGEQNPEIFETPVHLIHTEQFLFLNPFESSKYLSNISDNFYNREKRHDRSRWRRRPANRRLSPRKTRRSRKTKLISYHLLCVEDYDWHGSRVIALGLPTVRLRAGADHHSDEFPDLVLHMQVDRWFLDER